MLFGRSSWLAVNEKNLITSLWISGLNFHIFSFNHSFRFYTGLLPICYAGQLMSSAFNYWKKEGQVREEICGLQKPTPLFRYFRRNLVTLKVAYTSFSLLLIDMHCVFVCVCISFKFVFFVATGSFWWIKIFINFAAPQHSGCLTTELRGQCIARQLIRWASVPYSSSDVRIVGVTQVGDGLV